MGDAATPVLPDFTSQTAAVYKANLDAGFAVLDRISWAFAPHEQGTPNMTVRLEAGAIFAGTTLTEVAAQNTGTITAPSVDPRIDRVVIDESTGAVSVITGAEAPSPSPPAITAGKVPVAQVALVVSQTEIVNGDITDERPIARATGGGVESGTKMLFQQTAAPTGWTKETTHDDKALRIVSGTAGSAGATAFTSVFGSGKTAGAHTLTTGEIPAHPHVQHALNTGGGSDNKVNRSTNATGDVVTQTSTSTDGGTGGSHNHTLSLDLQYVDVIIASKD